MLLVDFRCDYLKYTMVISYYLFPISYFLLRRLGWKPIPSAARVTRDEVSGFKNDKKKAVWKTVPKAKEDTLCKVLSSRQLFFMYVSYNPETSSRVTLATLGIVFQTKLPTTDNQQPLYNLMIFLNSSLRNG